MKILARIVGGLLILLGIATAFKSYSEYGFYLYSPMEILGEYIVYIGCALIGIFLVALSYDKIKMPNIPTQHKQTARVLVRKGSLKQKITLGAICIAILMLLYPPKQKIGTTGRVLDEYYGWIFSNPYYNKGVVNIPMLALQLIVVVAVAFALLYAFKDKDTK